MPQSGGSENTYLLVPIVLMAVLLSAATILGPSLVSQSGFGSAIIVAAPLILATYALMASTMAGRGTIDLAIGPLVAFINVLVVQISGAGVATSMIGIFCIALGAGILYQVLFSLIIIFVRVQPIIVALSGFLALTGINLVIMPRPGGIAPQWMSNWGAGDTIFSPIFVILALATGGWLLLTATTFYSNLRLMGYDERAAYTTGVRIYLVRVGAHVLSGVFAGLSAICYTALIGSGDPTRGSNLTLTAVTALVLGGAALSGGRSSVAGALMGAIVLYLIGYVLSTLNFGAIQSFITEFSYGLILVLSLLLTLLIPIIQRHISFLSPYGTFVVLAAIVLGLMLQIATHPGHGPSMASAHAVHAALSETSNHIQNYFLLPQVSKGGTGLYRIDHITLSTIQKVAFSIAAFLVLVVVAVRVSVSDAIAKRRGAFLYVVMGTLIALAFLSFAGISGSQSSKRHAINPSVSANRQ